MIVVKVSSIYVLKHKLVKHELIFPSDMKTKYGEKKSPRLDFFHNSTNQLTRKRDEGLRSSIGTSHVCLTSLVKKKE